MKRLIKLSVEQKANKMLDYLLYIENINEKTYNELKDLIQNKDITGLQVQLIVNNFNDKNILNVLIKLFNDIKSDKDNKSATFISYHDKDDFSFLQNNTLYEKFIYFMNTFSNSCIDNILANYTYTKKTKFMFENIDFTKLDEQQLLLIKSYYGNNTINSILDFFYKGNSANELEGFLKDKNVFSKKKGRNI